VCHAQNADRTGQSHCHHATSLGNVHPEDHIIQPHPERRSGLDSHAFYDSGKNSTEPVIPIPFAYPSNNISNVFFLFDGTYNVPSTPSLLTHAPSTKFGLGVVTPT